MSSDLVISRIFMLYFVTVFYVTIKDLTPTHLKFHVFIKVVTRIMRSLFGFVGGGGDEVGGTEIWQKGAKWKWRWVAKDVLVELAHFDPKSDKNERWVASGKKLNNLGELPRAGEINYHYN